MRKYVLSLKDQGRAHDPDERERITKVMLLVKDHMQKAQKHK